MNSNFFRCKEETGVKPNMEREHKEHQDFYEDGCSICKLEQRLSKVLEMDEFKQFNPFREGKDREQLHL